MGGKEGRERKTVSYFCKPQTFGKQKKRELGPNSISHWRLCILSSWGCSGGGPEPVNWILGGDIKEPVCAPVLGNYCLQYPCVCI